MIREGEKVRQATVSSNIEIQAPKGRRKKSVAKKVKRKSAQHATGFMDFIRTQGVAGLAVGLALGGAVAIMVKSFIDNIVMPPIGFALGSAEGLRGLELVIGKTGGRQAILHYGIFLNDLINFIVIAIVIYMLFKVLRLEKLNKQ